MSKRVWVVLSIAAAAVVLGASIAAACGDKFIVASAGSRAFRSKYPSSILIFMNPSSRVPAADAEFRLQATLKAAGHKAVVADSEAEVQKAIASGKYDLVLADIVDVPGLRKQASAVSPRPVVVPLLYKPTPAELTAAEKEADCLVRPSKQSRDLLLVVDATMKSRSKGLTAVCEAGS